MFIDFYGLVSTSIALETIRPIRRGARAAPRCHLPPTRGPARSIHAVLLRRRSHWMDISSRGFVFFLCAVLGSGSVFPTLSVGAARL